MLVSRFSKIKLPGVIKIIMKALILAGGAGTRLYPLTINTPKPIVPIVNQPFLFRQIQSLKNAGIKDIILSTNYKPSVIEKTLGDGSSYGVNLRYLVEPLPMGTAGAYKFAESYLTTTTIVLNGDILTDLDLRTVLEQHKKYLAITTIVLAEVENPSAFGLVESSKDNKILRFLEKPKSDEIYAISTKTINAGIYIMEPQVLDYIPAGKNYSFEYHLFPDMLERSLNLRAFVLKNSYWLDIGTPEHYLQAHHDLLIGKVKNFQRESNPVLQISNSAEIDEYSCIANGCIIKSKAKIINSVIGKNVVIEENSIVQDSVIWSGTKIDSSAKVLNSIIGYNCYIGKNVVVKKNSVLGDKTIFDP